MPTCWYRIFCVAAVRKYWPTPSSIQRGSREDRVDSVFETLENSLLANSLDYPQRMRIEWTQLLKRLFTCVFFIYLLVGKFSHFPSFSLLFLYSTVQKSAVQYRYLFGASILQRSLMYCKVYSIEAPNKYLYCTTLFCTVLYKKRRLKEGK